MNVEHLVHMANQIGDFYATESDPQAVVADVANHLRRFWEPRMRRQLIDYVQAGGADLRPHVRDAVIALAASSP